MRLPISRRALRVVAATTVLTAGLLASPLRVHPALALFSGCRDDPTLTLSNLTTFDLSSSVNTSTSNVKQIVYNVHGPVGTFPLLMVDPDGLLNITSFVHYYADNSFGWYDVYTTVTTYSGSVWTTTTATNLQGPSLLGSNSASGYSGRTLHLHLR